MNADLRRVGVISLGCSKNRVDTEHMLGLLTNAGFVTETDPEKADVLIVNTCGFIEPAKQESIDTILEMAQYKKNGRCRTLVVTGCLSERYREELRAELPEVDIFLGVREYEKLPALLTGTAYQADPRARRLTTPPYSAYLRIADGCNNRCTYCAIPLIRGRLRSVPMPELIDEARRLADSGVTELTLIAQDTSGYGVDLYGEPRLIALMDALTQIESLRWVRLLYTYPDTVTRELIDAIARNPKIPNYLDMPLQHCNDEILKRMNRRGSKRHICDILQYIRTAYPDFILRTTMMVGFPGETDAQFEELLQFLSAYPFDRVGAFAFSPEDGTKAAELPDQVPQEVKDARLDALMRMQRGISLKRNERRIGQRVTALIQSTDGRTTHARSYAEAPEVDGEILLPARPQHAPGQYIEVTLEKALDYDMWGTQV
jgi:ribosomal protein S12 methylthiotransferase